MVTLKELVRVVALWYGLPVDMDGWRHPKKPLWNARSVVLWLTREYYFNPDRPQSIGSYSWVARKFRCDHTTVLHHVWKVNGDPQLLEEAKDVLEMLHAYERNKEHNKDQGLRTGSDLHLGAAERGDNSAEAEDGGASREQSSGTGLAEGCC